MLSVTKIICALAIFQMLQVKDRVRSLQTQSVDSCYQQQSMACKMWDYTNMDCSKRYLRCIPRILTHNDEITLLDLSSNKIRFISNGAFHGHQKLTTTLKLSVNVTSYLEDNTFSGLYNLLTLNFKENYIFYIQANVFSSLHKLQHLDISYNNISSLHDKAFTGLHDLRTLRLGGNHISLSDKTFSTLITLKYLELTSLDAIPGFPFQNLTSLETLLVRWRNLSSLNGTSLRGLENLDSLHLSFKTMSGDITGTPLAPLASLHKLHIHDTLYDCDSIGNIFIGLHRLQHLDISVGGSCPEIKFCSSYEEDWNPLTSRS